MILLQRIADEEFRLLLDEAPEEMQSVADVCRAKYRQATDGRERPSGMRERVQMRRTIAEQSYRACLDRGLLQTQAGRLGFGWETVLWWVVTMIVRQLIEEWF